METSKIVVSFRGPNQLPYMMIIREYWVDGEIVFAEVIHSVENKEDMKPEYSVDEIVRSTDVFFPNAMASEDVIHVD